MEITNWSNSGISLEQQQQFLQQAGLSALPDISKLTESQWSILAGIVGTETVNSIKESISIPPLSDPTLPPPPAKQGDWSAIMLKVAEIKAKLSDLMSKFSVEDIQNNKDKMKKVNEEDAKRIKESIDKLKKSINSGLIGKIFGWIGAIIGLIGAAIMTAATGGSAAPLLAIAVMGIVMMTLEESGAMEKIMEAMADNPALVMILLGPVAGGIIFGLMESGAIDEDQFKMAVQITLAAVMLISSIVGAVASGGANVASVAAKVASMIAQIAGSLASVGSGAAGIASSVYSHDSSQIQADMMENKAWLAKLQAILAEESERLEEILQRMNEGVSDISDVLQDIAGSHNKIFNNMGA